MGMMFILYGFQMKVDFTIFLIMMVFQIYGFMISKLKNTLKKPSLLMEILPFQRFPEMGK